MYKNNTSPALYHPLLLLNPWTFTVPTNLNNKNQICEYPTSELLTRQQKKNNDSITTAAFSPLMHDDN